MLAPLLVAIAVATASCGTREAEDDGKRAFARGVDESRRIASDAGREARRVPVPGGGRSHGDGGSSDSLLDLLFSFDVEPSAGPSSGSGRASHITYYVTIEGRRYQVTAATHIQAKWMARDGVRPRIDELDKEQAESYLLGWGDKLDIADGRRSVPAHYVVPDGTGDYVTYYWKGYRDAEQQLLDCFRASLEELLLKAP